MSRDAAGMSACATRYSGIMSYAFYPNLEAE
jgi:hypothetical protein